MLSLSLGLGPGRQSLDPSAQSLIARFATPPTAARAALISGTFSIWRAGGLLPKLEVVLFPAAADAQAALLNWISASFDATAVNSPTFTADRGFAGDALTSYLNMNWTPSASALFTLNSGHMSAWINSGTDTASNTLVSMGATTGSDGSWLTPRAVGDLLGGRINAAASGTFGASATTRGMISLSRTASNLTAGYKNGQPTGTASTASSALPNVAAFIGGRNAAGVLTNGSTFRHPFIAVGSKLTDAEILTLYTGAAFYLAGVGGQ